MTFSRRKASTSSKVGMNSAAFPFSVQRAYSLGANSFLVKPSDSNELVAMVKAMIEYWMRFNAVPSACAEPVAQESL